MKPAFEYALRAMLREIHDREVQIARMRFELSMWQAGVHPQQHWPSAIVRIGEAIQAMQRPGDATTEER